MAYNEWEHKKRGTFRKQQIRLEIDRLIGSVKNLDELLCELELKGYTVKRGKYISVKAPEQQRAVRLKTLVEDYTEQSLISKIRWHDVGANVTLSEKPSQMREDYTKTIAEVSQLAKDGKKIQRKRNPNISYSAENDMDIYKLSAQLSIINHDNIHSIGELEGRIEKLKEQYDNTTSELNRLIVKLERFSTLMEQAEEYFSLADKPTLSPTEQLKLNIGKQAMINNNIHSREDYDRLVSLHSETDKKIAVLKSNFENCNQLYEVYSDIADTYQKISKGDYISKLATEEQKRCADVQHKKKSI